MAIIIGQLAPTALYLDVAAAISGVGDPPGRAHPWGCRVELFKSLNCLYHIHAEFVNDLLSFQDRLGFSQVPCEADIVVDGKFARPMSTSK